MQCKTNTVEIRFSFYFCFIFYFYFIFFIFYFFFILHVLLRTFSLRGMDTLSREVTAVKVALRPSEKGSTQKGKNLLGSKFFLFRVDPFQKRLSVQN